MAKMSKQQVESINSKCKNGFSFYIRGFVEAGRKQLNKTITLKEDEKMIEAELCWAEEILHKKNPNGYNIPYNTGNYIPVLRVSVWRASKNSKAWISEGFGNKHIFNEYPSAKKMMNKLCEITEYATNELIYSLLPESERQEFKAITN